MSFLRAACKTGLERNLPLLLQLLFLKKTIYFLERWIIYTQKEREKDRPPTSSVPKGVGSQAGPGRSPEFHLSPSVWQGSKGPASAASQEQQPLLGKKYRAMGA